MYGRAPGERPPLTGGYMKNNKYEKQTSWMKNAPGWSTKKAMMDGLAYGGSGDGIGIVLRVFLNFFALMFFMLFYGMFQPEATTMAQVDAQAWDATKIALMINGGILGLRILYKIFRIVSDAVNGIIQNHNWEKKNK